MWLTALLLVHVLTALGIVGLVLLQHGKGADVGAAFGSGASGSLFGASGSANFLSRATAILAAVFFLTSLGLAYLATHKPRAEAGIMDSAAPVSAPSAPAPSKPAGEGDAATPSQGGDEKSKADAVPK
jgi:preprotein translocase subunit SecG